MLSALVVKGSFFIVIRLWFDVMPAVPGLAGAQLLAALGAAAILVSSVVALRQARLKLLIAYSTLAQIGYLFLMFPLAYDPGSGQLVSGAALTGGMMQTVSHATAKAAMFMTAGLIYGALGHDRIAELAGAARALPMTVFAFALAGVSLIGLPPSGGFLAKWLLLSTAVASGQWWWVVVILIGGLLSAGYVFLVVTRAMGTPSEPLKLRAPVPRHRELVALALAILSVLLGLVALGPVDLIQVGRPGARDWCTRNDERQRTLLGLALARPAGAAACLPVARPASAHAGAAVARTGAGARGRTVRRRRCAARARQRAPAADLPARSTGRGAARRRGGALDRRRRLRRELPARPDGQPGASSSAG